MNCTPEMLRLYAVTDRAWVGRQTLPQQVEAALKGGATMIQLREKQLDDAALLAEARDAAQQLLAGDPLLTRPEHAVLRRRVQALFRQKDGTLN